MSRNFKLRFKFQFMKLKINSINQYHATSSTTALVVEKLPDSFIEFLCALQHSFNQFINDIDKGTQRRCGEGSESALHLFTLCRESQLLWRLSPLRLEMGECVHHNFGEWCTAMAKQHSSDKTWEIVMMVMWQIWNVRNGWIFEKKKLDPIVTISKAMHLLGEFEAADTREVAPLVNIARSDEGKWSPPSIARYKLNTDATLSKEGKVGLGMVVRDGYGDVMMAAGRTLDGLTGVLEEEAEAMLFGLKYAYDAGLRRLEVEYDCLQLVELAKKNQELRSTAQMIVFDIIKLVSAFEYCSFAFNYRNCNTVAHSIAHYSLYLQEVRVWMEECPPKALPLVVADKMGLLSH
ncbi:uncharacterized protein [Spinacia oleracea]|uniref:RNase H type-1 domain-containing protein n=1 Tax=Spinacia oleracea TaxID=3562 RepID=A0ABM3QZ80_SPIOL|nr:uncharacterized protein LOC110776783 [Spinacia oleracea]